jgi:hypothetical protein
MLTVAAMVMGTAGISFAGKGKVPHAKLLDTVIVSDYGSQFAGSVETFLEGSGHKANPKFFVNGSNTNLGNFSGASGDAVSSLTGNIAVALPVVVFAPPIGTLGFANGFVEIFAPGSNGNTAPSVVLGSDLIEGQPNNTGIDISQGVAFANPFDLYPWRDTPDGDTLIKGRSDLLAVANYAVAGIIGPDNTVAESAAPCSGSERASAPSANSMSARSSALLILSPLTTVQWTSARLPDPRW